MLFQPLPTRAFAAFDALRGLQAELERALHTGPAAPALPIQLYERDDALLLRTPLPGVAAADLQLEIDGDTLTLSGERRDDPAAEGAVAQHRERPRGKFTRTLHLAFEVDAARVKAKLERGVLEVEIPRLVKNPPVKIQVQAADERN